MNVITRRDDGTPRTVELDQTEELASDSFERYLDSGNAIPFAAKLALNRYFPLCSADPAFVAWLSDDTVERRGTRYRIKPSARS